MKNEAVKTELFETMPISKAIARLSIPTVMSCLVMIVYNLADTYFVGMLNNPLENAAVTLAAPVILAFNAVTNLFGTGCASMMSRALGVKDYETVKRTSAFGIYSTIVCGLLFSFSITVFKPFFLNILGAGPENTVQTAAYLFWTVSLGAVPSMLNVVMSNLVRAEGSALHASIGVMSGCALNIVLDPIFILPFGLNMGASGAGLATLISNCVACLYFVGFLIAKRGRTFVTVSLKYARPGRYVVKNVCAVGIPASIQNLLNVTGMTVMNNSMSAFGSEAVAASGIAHKITMIPMYVSMGITQGVMSLIGYNFSSGNRKRMNSAIKATARIAVSFIVAATIVLFVFSENITRAFIENQLTVEYGTAFMRGMSLAQPFLCVDFLGVAVYQACGMGRTSLIFAIFRKIVLEIPAMLILNRIRPMYGLAYAQPAAELILAVAAVVCLKRIMKQPSPQKTPVGPPWGRG